MKKLFIFFFSLFTLTSYLGAKSVSPKKVFYINSYHTGLYWSDEIEKNIKKVLFKSKIPIEFKRVEMDSKRNNIESYKIKTALKIKNEIEKFKPDVIITSDDNAIKYVILPYLKNSTIPIIFCGINGTIKKYEQLPNNITGMEEVQPISQIVDTLKKYAKGTRIGSLDDDSYSVKLQNQFFEKQLNQKIITKYAKTIKEWKEDYIYLQNNTDMLLLGNSGALVDWNKNKEELEDFVKKETKIPSAAWDITLKKFAMMIFVNKPEEQGKWAAKTALEILNGKKVNDIKIVKNKESRILINTTLAKKLNIIFPFDFIDYAEIVQ